MKTLKMNDKLQYELLYEAMVGRPQGYNIQQSRIIGQVLDKFEAMGKVSEVMENGVTLFTPISLPNQIELEDAQFDLMSEVFREMKWSGSGVRKAIIVDDWLMETAKGG